MRFQRFGNFQRFFFHQRFLFLVFGSLWAALWSINNHHQQQYLAPIVRCSPKSNTRLIQEFNGKNIELGKFLRNIFRRFLFRQTSSSASIVRVKHHLFSSLDLDSCWLIHFLLWAWAGRGSHICHQQLKLKQLFA